MAVAQPVYQEVDSVRVYSISIITLGYMERADANDIYDYVRLVGEEELAPSGYDYGTWQMAGHSYYMTDGDSVLRRAPCICGCECGRKD